MRGDMNPEVREVNMSRIQMLQLLITQRLSAAAEEIFREFGRTMAEYEEEITRAKMEISRQRRLLDLSRKPRVSLQLRGGALCEQQDWRFSVDLNEMKSPQIKEEEEEESWSTQQEEAQEEAQQTMEQNDVKLFQSDGPEEEVNNHTPSSMFQIQEEEEPRPGTSVEDEDLSWTQPDLEAPLSEVVTSYVCSVCGRAFAQRPLWADHVQEHRTAHSRADKSYTCDICGKRLTRFDGYQKHLRIHTGEKPYGCGECGRRFSDNSNYKRHIRTHTGSKEKPSVQPGD
ncbi:zinc finger protein 500-like [Limanda limanda]|uniref:zinc finger protein 500-like n=1 Tax=Limanda limanda TaxID=27771 RepID=UPI0029C72918|nr:zinc finger protein 500-like [Limanda limanda]